MENNISIAYIGTSDKVISNLEAHSNITLERLPNALTAINYMKEGRKPDAICCELNVAGGSAFEIFETLQTNNYLHHIAFILIAFEFRKEIYFEAQRLKIDDYYVIPNPEPDDLIGRITFLKGFKNKFETAEETVVHLPETKVPHSKRVFDLIMASFALLMLSPLLLIVILAIRIESKGKVYYTSRRYGRFPFDFYKLRSMRTGADLQIDKLAKEKNQYTDAQKPVEIEYGFKCPQCELLESEGKNCSQVYGNGTKSMCDHWINQQNKFIIEIKAKNRIDYNAPCPRCSALGKACSEIKQGENPDICNDWHVFQNNVINKSKASYIKISNDPRVTKVGKFIRNTSIDELPQLINVLKGDMSIVGNRPLPLNEAELLLRDSNLKRFLAPAGITGLWQVELRGKGGVMSEAERNNLDNEYADLFINNKYSFWYDLKLILRTIPALFQKDSV